MKRTAKPGEGRCQAVGRIAFEQADDGGDAAPVLLFRDCLFNQRGQGRAGSPSARVRPWRLGLLAVAVPL
jgi:hypothetical protein